MYDHLSVVLGAYFCVSTWNVAALVTGVNHCGFVALYIEQYIRDLSNTIFAVKILHQI